MEEENLEKKQPEVDLPEMHIKIKKPKKLSPFEQKLNDLIARFGKIPFVDKMLFIHHLQIMVKAGLTIVEGLRILSEETENKKFKKVIEEIKAQVEKGQQFSEALKKHPKVIPPVYVSMISAGETAGKMEEALEQVSNQMQKNHDLISKIKGAMIYPAVITVAMVGVALIVVFYILPEFLVMFDEFDADLPGATIALIKIVEFAQNWTIEIIIGVIALVITWIRLIKILSFKRKVHKIFLKLPIAGKIIKKINLARFSLTLSSLLKSSISIVEALDISADVVSNYTYKDTLRYAAENIKKGDALSAILQKFPNIYPPMVTEMIMVGEQTGESEKMLNELSNYFSNEVDSTMKNFSTVIEPVIILMLGLGVAGIAVAVIMPTYSLSQSF